VDITVANDTGVSALTSSDQFTYTAASAPSVSSLSTHTGTTDGATTVTITGSNFTQAQDVLFGAVPAASFTVNSPSSITAISPAQYAGTVDVTVTTFSGISATSSSDTFAYTNASGPSVTSMDVHTGTTVGAVTVTITGSGFTTATSVYFGNVPASFIVNSNSSITAIAPLQAAGTVHVTVTTNSGTSSTSGSDTFAYTNASPPNLSFLSLTTGSTTGGDLVVIAGSNFTGATDVKFGGVEAPFIVISDNAIEAVSPSHASGTVDVTVTTYSATSSTTSADTFTYSVPALPTVTALSSDTGTTAGGEFVTLTGTGFTNAYEVNFGDTPLFNFTVNSDTQITLFTPAAPAGTIDVQVLTDAGTSLPVSADRFTYTAASAPAVTSLDTHTGSTAGGTVVNLTGTDFGGATDVFFGGVEASSFVVNSGTSITATAPNQATGTVDVAVWTMTGSSATSSSDTFAYTAASAPSVSSLSVHTGSTAGGTLVSINGSNFTSATGVSFGSVAATYTVASDSLITAYASAESAGNVDVTVTTDAGTSSTSSADTFSFAAASAPSVSAVTAASGTTAGGDTVVILGSNFTSATGVSFGSIAATSYTVNADNSITAIAPPEAAATVDITVTTGGGTSSTSSADHYTFTNVTASAPTVTGLDIATGYTGGGRVVTITGTDFAGTTGVSFGANAASSYTVVSGTEIVATAPAGSAGTVHVTVTTNNGTSATGSPDQFTYTATGLPTISSLGTSSGTTAGGTSLSITGTNFTSVTAVSFGGFAAASYTVNSSTSITATSPALPVGTYGVVISTASGDSAASTFTVTAASAPTVSSLGTSSGNSEGGTSVAITGTNFTGATGVFFGGVAASSFTVNSATSITAVSPPQYAGGYDVTVVTHAATSALSSGDRFTVSAATTAAVTALGTHTGTTAGGTTVTVTGTDFTGAYDVRFGGVSADSFTLNSSTSITAISPAQAAGTVDVQVFTYSGSSPANSSDTFTYSASVPTVTALATHTGTTAGGTSVAVTGTNFTAATGVSFGSYAAQTYTVNSSTSITAVAPAQAAGTVDVTVTAYGGTSSTSSSDTFGYTNASVPSVSAVTANSGSTVGGDLITVTGSHFTGATGVSFGSVPAASFTVLSDTAILAADPAAASAGTVDVTVTAYAGTSSTGSSDTFGYTAASVPSLSSLSTSSGGTGGVTAVTITGSGFLTATGVSFGGAAASFTVLGDSSISAIAPPNTAGVFDVTVIGPGGASALSSSDRFTYTAASAPNVSSLGTTTGSTAGGTSVTITGTNFTGAGGVFFGGLAAASFTVVSSTTITAVSPSQAAGTVDVRVLTPTGTSAVSSNDTFSYTNASAPTVSALSLTTGTTAGGITVTVSGAYFTGATQVLFGTVAASFTVLNDGYLTAVVPVQASGTVDVTVTTPSGTSATSSADHFTYTSAASPSVTSVAGDSGAPQGGNTVVVLGSGFSGATAVDFGSTAATSFTVLSDNAISAIAPGPMSTATVDITITTAGGTSSTGSADHYTYTGPLVLKGINGLTVSGLTLDDGVEIIGSTNITLLGNTIDNSSGSNDGISVNSASSNITIGGSGTGQGNTIDDNGGNGISIAGSNVTVLDNDIEGNTDDGILVSGGSSATITGNTIYNPGLYCLEIQNSTTVTVLGNTISTTTGGDGIYVNSGSSTITIGGSSTGQSNNINFQGGNGITIAGSHVTVLGNDITENGWAYGGSGAMDGIAVTATAGNVTIGGGASGQGNIIDDDVGNGVYINGANVTVLGNSITDNGSGSGTNLNGIYVGSAAGNVTIGGTGTGQGNTITNNANNGIEILGANVVVEDNTITGNSNVDVLVDGGSGVTLSGNTLNNLAISSGDITLSGTSTISNLTVSGGTLTESGSLTVSSVLTQSGGTIDLTSGITLTVSYSYSFTGGVLALQGGTVAVSTLSISSGATLEGAGTVSGNVDNYGTISLGAPYTRGSLHITGNYTQESSGVFNVKLDSNSLSDHDKLLIDGTATLDGTFNATLASGYTPTSGDIFSVLESAGITGSFGSINLPTYGGGSLSSSFDGANKKFRLTAS
jgi:parallel beta-helix repeat protein